MKNGQAVKEKKLSIYEIVACFVISVVFEQYVQAELGEKSSYGIQNLCTTCLQKCFTKRKFTQFLPNQQANEVKNNVEKQRCTQLFSCPQLHLVAQPIHINAGLLFFHQGWDHSHK